MPQIPLFNLLSEDALYLTQGHSSPGQVSIDQLLPNLQQACNTTWTQWAQEGIQCETKGSTFYKLSSASSEYSSRRCSFTAETPASSTGTMYEQQNHRQKIPSPPAVRCEHFWPRFDSQKGGICAQETWQRESVNAS